MHFFVHLAFLYGAIHHALASPIISNDLVNRDGASAGEPPIRYLDADDNNNHKKDDIVITFPKDLESKLNEFFKPRMDDCKVSKKRASGTETAVDCLIEDLEDAILNLKKGGMLADLVQFFQYLPANLPIPVFDDKFANNAYQRLLLLFWDDAATFDENLDAALYNPAATLMFFVVVGPVIKGSFYVGGQLYISAKNFYRKKKDDEKPKCYDLNSPFAPQCPKDYCKGENGRCTTAAFLDCECVPTQCPDPNKLLYRCEDCDGEKGICRSDDKKNCHCVHEATIFVNPGTKEEWELRQKILASLPKYDPNKEKENKDEGKNEDKNEDKAKCMIDLEPDLYKNPDKWKWVQKKGLDEDIDKFCDESFKGLDGEGAGGFTSSSFRQGDLNEVNLKAEFETGAKATAGDCKEMLKKISDNCDQISGPKLKNAVEYNWKWGGEITKNKVTYTIVPIANRVAQKKREDDSHWVEVKKEIPKEEPKKTRTGKNGKEWDMLALHKCLHGLREDKWNKGEKKFNCEGLVEYSFGAHWTYNSWPDCFKNTWDTLSWSIMHEGGIDVTAVHKGGKTLGTLTKCWLAIRS